MNYLIGYIKQYYYAGLSWSEILKDIWLELTDGRNHTYP